MQKYFNVIADLQGNVVAGAKVEVTKQDGTPASLFSDNGITAITGNVLTTDTLGEFAFYAADGRYNLTISGATINPAIQISDILLNDSSTATLSSPAGAGEVGTTPAGTLTSSTVQAALNELDTKKSSLTQLAAAGGAGLIGNTPAGGIGSTTVQAALNELDSKKATTGSVTAAQNTADAAMPTATLAAAGGAGLVGNTPAGNIASTTVQAALNELDSEKAAKTDLAASGGAGLVGFQQAGTGSVARTMQAKAREMISVLDFGADPTYTTDSTAAFQAAILSGAWNGTTVFVPNGTYRIEGDLLIGTNGTDNFYSVHLVGESTLGSVLLRPAGTSTGKMLTVNGFHNIIEKLTLISEVSGGNYSASHGLYIRGNPQTGTNGLGTKHCSFRDLQIYRVGVGIQLGNYDVDAKDPDIETNTFERINVSDCNGGLFINGQNILHNPFRSCHFVDCRDYLVKQSRGSDAWFDRCYFGGLHDYLTSNYNVASTSKISITAGLVGFVGCRFEDWASTTGNATQRYAVNVNAAAASVVYLAANVFTTRDNATTELCCSFTGSGSAGAVTTKVTLIDNDFGGTVAFDTIDVFSVGNTYRGTGGTSVNGRILSANQKSGLFRDVFMDSNQQQELNSVKFKRNSSAPITIERPAVANTSEWQGYFFATEDALNWGRQGMAAANATAGHESSLWILANRMNGSFLQVRLAANTIPPVQGVWNVGDRVINSAPAVSSPKGWINTTAGGASSTTRADATAYAAGVYAKWPTGLTVWECTTAGTSTTGAPDITGKAVGQTVADGTVVWTMRATAQANFVSEGNL